MNFHARLLRWCIFLCASSASVLAQVAPPVRVMPLGDSVTHGGQGYASWRYPLWQALTAAGANVDFTGSLNTVFGSQPTAADYADYYLTFDRDHEGHSGVRTDQALAEIDAWAAGALPDVVLIHLGTNDIGQRGAAGVDPAAQNLGTIVSRLRAVNPSVRVVLAQIIPVNPAVPGYGPNLVHIPSLNSAIMSLGATLHTAQSPVLVADLFTGFDYTTMLWDGLHPNLVGEARMAQCWLPAVRKLIAGSLPTAPLIAIAPAPQSVGIGGSVTFTVNAAGHAPLSYQWNKDGSPIAGANAPAFTIASAQADEMGFYSVTVGSPYGAVTSAAATLTVGRHSMRFFGTGAPGGDRVKIALDAPPRSVDVGAGDFTIELWLKAMSGANPQPAVVPGATVDWIYGNIFLDNDINGPGDFGDYGFSLGNGRVVFGCENDEGIARTIVGATDVADGRWHHIALTRAAASGQLRLWVDGLLEASGIGPAGNLSYRDGRETDFPNDPFIVLGAEKHAFEAWFDNAFNGWIDELRFSTSVRYTAPFTRPAAPFVPDTQTAALYHFDEGGDTAITDSSGAAGGPSDGVRLIGGAQAGPIYDPATPFNETYAGWASTFIADPSERNPLANPDFDALPNLLEYALGQPPSVPLFAPAAIERDASGRLQLDFLCQSAPDLTYVIEASSAIGGPWQVLFTSSGPANVAAPLSITDTGATPGGPQRLIRLRVTLP